MGHHGMAYTMADTQVSRADYGSGSMYQRSSDWRWLASFEDGYTESGKRKRGSVSGPGCVDGCKPRCPHVAAIKRKIRDKRLERELNSQRPAKRTTSVAKWSTTWLENIQSQVRPSAYETDRAAVRAIVAAIGERKLADLAPSDVTEVAKYLSRRGKSTSTALRYHGSLIRMLKAASLEGYNIAPNVLLVKNPVAAVNDREAIPLDEATKILSHVSTLPDGSRWALALLQGLRQAEALGLTWEQVDLNAGALTIAWQMKSLRYVDPKDPSRGFQVPDGYEIRQLAGATHLVRPKSAAGWRVQPLIPWAANALSEWQETSGRTTGLVWPGRTQRGVTWPRNPASDRKEWKAIQAAVGVRHRAGRPFEVHEARNTTATILMELKVAESVRIAIMGHSNIATTRGYEHVDITQSRLALEQVGERFGLR